MINLIKKREYFLRGTQEESNIIFSDLNLESFLKDEKKPLVERVRNIYKELLRIAIEGKNQENSILVEKTLDYLHDNYYNFQAKEHTNWWQWEIGYPLLLCDILCIFYDYFSKETILKYLNVTKYFQPDPIYSGNNPVALHPSGNPLRVSTGGNRVDLCKISFLRGMLLNDSEECTHALNALKEVWELKTETEITSLNNRDGFYADGSFIQHGFIPYAGTYGNVLLSGIGEILYLLGDNEDLKNSIEVDEIAQRILDSFEPFFFKGSISDIVCGRAITRSGDNHQRAHEVLNSILLISEGTSNNFKKRLQKIVKREFFLDKHYNHIENEMRIFYKNLYKSLLENEILEPTSYKTQNFIFNEMNRVFKRTENFSIGLALHSNKIGNYESFNGENEKGWFTGDGAIYIEDTGDSYINYWNGIDFNFIPGTTEIKENMLGKNTSSTMENMPQNTLAHAYVKDSKIYAEMDFINYSDELSSNKKYVIHPWGIEYIESNIKSSKNFYSTIENKKLYNESSFKITRINNQLIKVIIDNREYSIYTEIPVNYKIYTKNSQKYIALWLEYLHDTKNLEIKYKIKIYNSF